MQPPRDLARSTVLSAWGISLRGMAFRARLCSTPPQKIHRGHARPDPRGTFLHQISLHPLPAPQGLPPLATHWQGTRSERRPSLGVAGRVGDVDHIGAAHVH
eukprot:5074822-Prymnesium_polylepis.1